MKLSDAPSTEVSTIINAPIATVWAIVSDINVPADSSTEFGGAEWQDGATCPAVGAQFVGRNSHKAIGNWETTATVTVADPEREFTYVIGDVDAPGSKWTYRLDPTDEGVVLTQRAQIGPGRSGLSYAIDAMPDKEPRIVEKRLGEHEANMKANLARIKQLAESTE